jgi:hypothetical protein
MPARNDTSGQSKSTWIEPRIYFTGIQYARLDPTDFRNLVSMTTCFVVTCWGTTSIRSLQIMQVAQNINYFTTTSFELKCLILKMEWIVSLTSCNRAPLVKGRFDCRTHERIVEKSKKVYFARLSSSSRSKDFRSFIRTLSVLSKHKMPPFEKGTSFKLWWFRRSAPSGFNLRCWNHILDQSRYYRCPIWWIVSVLYLSHSAVRAFLLVVLSMFQISNFYETQDAATVLCREVATSLALHGPSNGAQKICATNRAWRMED